MIQLRRLVRALHHLRGRRRPDDGPATRDDLGLCEDANGEHHTVELALVDAGPGDQVLVHAGVALVTL